MECKKRKPIPSTGEQLPQQPPSKKPATAATTPNPPLRVAFIGNSLTYYNDLPHVVQSFLQHHRRFSNSGSAVAGDVVVGAVLRGGQSLPSLLKSGADTSESPGRAGACIGNRDMFDTVPALLAAPEGWDYIVFQDHTQAPARPDTQPLHVSSCTPNEVSRGRSLACLTEHYAPLLLAAGRSSGNSDQNCRAENCPSKPPVMVCYETYGYRRPAKDSHEISSDFTAMNDRLAEGYALYAQALRSAGLRTLSVHVGAAFAQLRSKSVELWEHLYQDDNFHPTASGTFLIAAHLTQAIADDLHTRQQGRKREQHEKSEQTKEPTTAKGGRWLFPAVPPAMRPSVTGAATATNAGGDDSSVAADEGDEEPPDFQLELPAEWPSAAVCYRGQAVPSDAELEAVLLCAGPTAVAK